MANPKLNQFHLLEEIDTAKDIDLFKFKYLGFKEIGLGFQEHYFKVEGLNDVEPVGITISMAIHHCFLGFDNPETPLTVNQISAVILSYESTLREYTAEVILKHEGKVKEKKNKEGKCLK